MVKTGFSQVNINEDIDFIMGGMFLEFKTNEVHTPLFASAWALEDEKTKVIWVSCDIVVLNSEMVQKIQQEVERETGVNASNVLVSATHTHTGPNTCNVSIYSKTKDLSYLKDIFKRVVKACKEAWDNRETAYMGYADSKVEKCCFNRRYLMKNGKSQMHPGGPDNPDRLIKEGLEDKQLQVVWFEDENNEKKGIIVNFSSHASVMYGLKVISAGYPGVMRRVIKKIYGDIPVLFLLGCCGNTSPVDHEHDPTWGRGMDSTERIGTIIGAEVVKSIASTRVVKIPLDNIRFDHGLAKLFYRDIDDEQQEIADRIISENNKGNLKIKINNGNVENVAELALANKVDLLTNMKKTSSFYEASIACLKIGKVTFITNPAELFVEYQLNMKKRIESDNVISVSITNGWCNYVATKHGFLFKGYEVDQGWFDWEAGQTIEDKCVELANSLRGDCHG